MNTKLQLIKAAILPYLTYCHRTWQFCKASDTRKLEQIQERGVFKDKQSAYEDLLRRANLPTLHNRISIAGHRYSNVTFKKVTFRKTKAINTVTDSGGSVWY